MVDENRLAVDIYDKTGIDIYSDEGKAKLFVKDYDPEQSIANNLDLDAVNKAMKEHSAVVRRQEKGEQIEAEKIAAKEAAEYEQNRVAAGLPPEGQGSAGNGGQGGQASPVSKGQPIEGGGGGEGPKISTKYQDALAAFRKRHTASIGPENALSSRITATVDGRPIDITKTENRNMVEDIIRGRPTMADFPEYVRLKEKAEIERLRNNRIEDHERFLETQRYYEQRNREADDRAVAGGYFRSERQWDALGRKRGADETLVSGDGNETVKEMRGKVSAARKALKDSGGYSPKSLDNLDRLLEKSLGSGGLTNAQVSAWNRQMDNVAATVKRQVERHKAEQGARTLRANREFLGDELSRGLSDANVNALADSMRNDARGQLVSEWRSAGPAGLTGFALTGWNDRARGLGLDFIGHGRELVNSTGTDEASVKLRQQRLAELQDFVANGGTSDEYYERVGRDSFLNNRYTDPTYGGSGVSGIRIDNARDAATEAELKKHEGVTFGTEQVPPEATAENAAEHPLYGGRGSYGALQPKAKAPSGGSAGDTAAIPSKPVTQEDADRVFGAQSGGRSYPSLLPRRRR